MLSSGAFMVLISVVALIGTPALAAQQIAFTALSTAFLPGFAFSIAATALVGQSIGARIPSDARLAWSISLRWAMVWLGVGGVIVFLLPHQIMSVFTSDTAVIDAGVSALRALSLSLPFWAVWFVSSGSLRGSGDTRTPLIVGASTMWLAVFLALDRCQLVRCRLGLGLARLRDYHDSGGDLDVVDLQATRERLRTGTRPAA